MSTPRRLEPGGISCDVRFHPRQSANPKTSWTAGGISPQGIRENRSCSWRTARPTWSKDHPRPCVARVGWSSNAASSRPPVVMPCWFAQSSTGLATARCRPITRAPTSPSGTGSGSAISEKSEADKGFPR